MAANSEWRLRLIRPFDYVNKSRIHRTGIFGQLYLEKIGTFESIYLCDTLEPPLRVAHSFIPCGTYPLSVTYSPKFGRKLPLLKDVPHRSGIRIHAGNTVKDTHGCILVGKHNNVSSLGDSRHTLNSLLITILKYNVSEIIVDEDLPF